MARTAAIDKQPVKKWAVLQQCYHHYVVANLNLDQLFSERYGKLGDRAFNRMEKAGCHTGV